MTLIDALDHYHYPVAGEMIPLGVLRRELKEIYRVDVSQISLLETLHRLSRPVALVGDALVCANVARVPWRVPHPIHPPLVVRDDHLVSAIQLVTGTRVR
jgi:hypothetical protein